MHDGSMKDMAEPEHAGGVWNGFYLGGHAGSTTTPRA